MSTYKQILVPTDFSPTSAAAAMRARALADCFSARITVVHVVDYVPPGYVAPELPTNMSSPQALRSRAQAHLEEWINDNSLAGSEPRIVVGSAKKEIVKLANELSVDVIVMGTQGETGLARILGSTTNAVIHNARCDVLAVHSDD
jgi:universal stress protein A